MVLLTRAPAFDPTAPHLLLLLLVLLLLLLLLLVSLWDELPCP
jgi:hypothetical protein